MTMNDLSSMRLWILIASIIILIALLTYVTVRAKKKLTKAAKIATATCILTLFVSNTAMYIGTDTFIRTAISHGMYDSGNAVSDVVEYIKKTPVEDTLPDDLTDTMVLYYRFDCTDCHMLYDDIIKEIETFEQRTGDKIYWVSTRSEQGELLRETYTVSSVPTLMYIRDPNGIMPYYTELIYFKEGDEVKFYAEAWDKILEIRDQYTTGNRFAK